MNKIKSLQNIFNKWSFLLLMIVVYITVFFIDKNIFLQSANFAYDILLKILPVLLLVLVLMILVNLYITPKVIIKYLNNSGTKKWIYAIIGGILSTGPTYVWYPLLADLKNKKVSHGIIACFLYNWAIKLPLIPVIIMYFDIKFVIILCIVMMLTSIMQGKIIDYFLPNNK